MFPEILKQTGLSLERLQSFCLVAEAGGITRAAKGDPTKQSLYSRQLKELEEFFGAELVRRKGRGIVLTSAGQRLRDIVREQFTALSDFQHECKGQPVEVVVGAGDSIIQWVFMPRLAVVLNQLPNMRLGFLNLDTQEIVRRVGDGEIDFGVVRKDAAAKSLRGVALGQFFYSLFVPKTLLREGKQSEPVHKLLSRLPLATLEGEGTFKKELATVVIKHRLRLNVELECSSFPLVARALEVGVVAAILPSVARTTLSQDKVVEVKADMLHHLQRQMWLIWNPRLFRIRTAMTNAAEVFATAWRLE